MNHREGAAMTLQELIELARTTRDAEFLAHPDVQKCKE